MTGRIHVKHGGAWQIINYLWLKYRGAWQDPKGGWVKHQGFWYQVYPWDPSLKLDFDFTKGVFDPRLTFSRDGHASYMNAAGVIDYAGSNYVYPSEDFVHANWQKVNGGTVSAGIITAPGGGLADRLNHQTTGTVLGGGIQGNFGGLYYASNRYIVSVYAKKGSKNFLVLRMDGITNIAYFNLATGVPGNVGGIISSNGMQDVGDGWFRCWAVGKGSWGYNHIAVGENNGSPNCTSAGDIYIWGAQLELVGNTSVPGPYLKTQDVVPLRHRGTPRFDYDPFTHECLGLLVENSQNMQTQYPYDIAGSSWVKMLCTATANVAVAPDGLQVAARVVATNFPASVYNTGPTSTGLRYTTLAYVKKDNSDWIYLIVQSTSDATGVPRVWFNLATGTVGTKEAPIIEAGIDALPNGWFRIWATRIGTTASNRRIDVGLCNADASTVCSVGTAFFIWYAGIENSAAPTSVHPVGLTGRSADIVTLTGTAFSDVYNPAAGTWVIDFELWTEVSDGSSFFQTLLHLTDAGGGTQIRAYIRDGAVLTYNVTSVVASLNYGVMTRGKHRLAISYSLNDFAMCLDGGGVLLDKLGAVPVMTKIGIGCDPNSATLGLQTMMGRVQRVRYYSVDKSDAELKALTTYHAIDMWLAWKTNEFETIAPRWDLTYAGEVGDQQQLQVDTDPNFGTPNTELRTVTVATNTTTVEMGATFNLLAGFTYHSRVKRTRGTKVDYSNVISKTIKLSGAAFAAWNPGDKAASVTLSASDKIATSNLAGYRGVRGIGPKALGAGKVHVEFRSPVANGANWGVGIANASALLTTYVGATGNNSVGLSAASTAGSVLYRNGASQGAVFPYSRAFLTNTWYAMEIDFTAETIRFGDELGWGTAYTYSGVAGPYFLIWTADTLNNSIEINTGQTEWAIRPSTDYAPWGV